MEIRVAGSRRERLLGLALRAGPPGHALMLPGCRSIHTFGMRFALDLVWLDEQGRVLAVDEAVPPGESGRGATRPRWSSLRRAG